MSARISIIGDGAMGTVSANMLAENGHAVLLWSAFPDAAAALAATRENAAFLPGFRLHDRVEVAGDDSRALAGAELAVSAVPTQFIRGVWGRLAHRVPADLPICSVAKGIENHTLLRPTQILQAVLARVRSEYPGVEIAGWQNGYFKPEDEWNIARKIRASRADILFIAFGTPKKEIWVGRYLQAMSVPVVHGVGGSFDVFAGLIPRAPVWMQKAGLEWLFRLLQEPGRMWKRYLVTNSLFIGMLAREILRIRFGWPRSEPAGRETV